MFFLVAALMLLSSIAFGQTDRSSDDPRDYYTDVIINRQPSTSFVHVVVTVTWNFSVPYLGAQGMGHKMYFQKNDVLSLSFNAKPSEVQLVTQTVVSIRFYNANWELRGGGDRTFSGYHAQIVYSGWPNDFQISEIGGGNEPQ
ncbi:MAG: hypothetical protein LBH92_09100 [Bacteroidales bacterium]|nr:hypothetical protein [Bacteroidales bacterium]